jgi:hypothetical protein
MKQRNDIMKKNNDIIKQPMKNINTMKIMKKFLFLKIFLLTLYSPTIFAITCSTGSGGSSGSYSWKEVKDNDENEFAKRYGHSSVEFDGKMWVIGGYSSSTERNDVYSSVDGKTWTPVRADGDANGFTARNDHTSVVFDDGKGEKMWVIGGIHDNSVRNSVYSSTDGKTWTIVRDDGATRGFPARSGHTSVVFDDGKGEKMWVMTGVQGAVNRTDVWSSTNGKTWTEVREQAKGDTEFGLRTNAASVVFNDGKGEGEKMWIIGGIQVSSFVSANKNDVWSSTNGETWNKVSDGSSDSFSPVQGHRAVVFNDGRDEKMWITAGLSPSFTNRVYSSTNGETWTEETTDSSKKFEARTFHSSIVFNNRLWVIGGSIFLNQVNDVWSYSKD